MEGREVVQVQVMVVVVVVVVVAGARPLLQVRLPKSAGRCRQSLGASMLTAVATQWRWRQVLLPLLAPQPRHQPRRSQLSGRPTSRPNSEWAPTTSRSGESAPW